VNKEAEFVPTREQRRDVCMMVHSEWDHKMMAQDLGISISTLKKHFREELKNGAELLEKYAKMAFAERALDKGSIPALKILAGHDQRPRLGVSKAPAAPKPEVLGKKEQRKQVAKDAASGIYAVPAPPSQMNGRHKTN
jgi:hypothetical protein